MEVHFHNPADYFLPHIGKLVQGFPPPLGYEYHFQLPLDSVDGILLETSKRLVARVVKVRGMETLEGKINAYIVRLETVGVTREQFQGLVSAPWLGNFGWDTPQEPTLY